ncbi:MAG: hypothetical protein H5U40_03025 [Polyangiaceae bacterium]|nr:hypothetical protein [Polyangiaceae bacterium]
MGSRVRRRVGEKVDQYRTQHADREAWQEEGQESKASPTQQVTERARDIKESAERRLHGVEERAKERADRAKLRADRAREGVRERSQRARSAVGQRGDRAREGLRSASHQSRRVLEDEPLAVAGLGLAFGAVLAGAMPMIQEGRERARHARHEAKERQEHEARAYAPQPDDVEFAIETQETLTWDPAPRVEPEGPEPFLPEDDDSRIR